MRANFRGASLFGVGLRVLLALASLGLGSAAAAESAVRHIEVHPSGEGYVADLVMWAPVPRELAFEVLTDFEHAPHWAPNIVESHVLKREAHRTTVEYRGIAHFGAWNIPFTAVREVESTAPALIESVQISGTMKQQRSRITLTPDGGGTRLDYHLEMVPSTISRVLVTRARIEQELRDTFNAAEGEMLRRKSVAAPTAR
jgi:uncharacterized protein YndB with AHSA1/START domain